MRKAKRPAALTRMVSWSHQLLTEVLAPGDTAVDLTAGRGHDTLALATAVGSGGRVVALDVQSEALCQAEQMLTARGFAVQRLGPRQSVPEPPGVYLVHACHSRLSRVMRYRPRAVIANLGYLPGGDTERITRPETTLAAISQALGLLTPGGRLAVTLYPAHPGGSEEAAAVSDWFSRLPRETWQVLRLSVANCPDAPCLWLAERSVRERRNDAVAVSPNLDGLAKKRTMQGAQLSSNEAY